MSKQKPEKNFAPEKNGKKREKTAKQTVKARLPRGFADMSAADLRASGKIAAKISEIYQLYGFEPLETPFIEYTDALGKFLPDTDRPNAGVFSFRDDDEQWLSLRYDLTAPLARFYAENMTELPKPFRSFRHGFVFRNEKPGPGRFRQFLQFDADTLGAASPAADAEMCMMAADALEHLGIKRGDYRIRVNNRKILDGILEHIGLDGAEGQARRLTVLRAVDKLDKFGLSGVAELLGKGRLDESGDFTKGAELDAKQQKTVLSFMQAGGKNAAETLAKLDALTQGSAKGSEGAAELRQIQALIAAAGYENRIQIDPSIVRGLEYYTGPVFEAELCFPVTNEKGQQVVFGSIGGGGRYDGLVSRFSNNHIPATGFSIGVSRLTAALKNLGKLEDSGRKGPVLVLAMDRDEESLSLYQQMTAELRQSGIRAELYLGDSGMKAQMKYADKRGAPCVLIQGSAERETGTVEIKDLIEGAKLAAQIEDNEKWRQENPAQSTAARKNIVAEVKKLLAKHS